MLLLRIYSANTGIELGYVKTQKYRVLVQGITEVQLKATESTSKSAEELAKYLLIMNDLETRPDEICAAPNRLEGWELCNPEKLTGICFKLYLNRCGPDQHYIINIP